MKQIVVASAGWVLLGIREKDLAGCLRLSGASVIRMWGTTGGLGQIALNGPTKATVLDPCGSVTLPYTSVIMVIDCKETK